MNHTRESLGRGALGLVAAFYFIVPAALAQDVPPAADSGVHSSNPPGYDAAVNEAFEEYEAGHFAEARALFARAHAIYPNARTLRGIGAAEFELRNYRTAADYLEQALASKVKLLEGDARADAEALLARAQGFLGQVQLDVHPGKARVMVDGTPIEVDSGTTLVLSVGDHTLEIRAEGYAPEKRTVSVKGGEHQELRVTLQLPTLVEAAQPQPTPAEPSGGPGIAPWIVIGIAGAVAVTGSVFVAVALSDKSKVENATLGTSWKDVKSANERVPAFSTVGFVVAGAGVAGVIAGLVWLGMAGSDTAAEEPAVQVGLSGDSIAVSGSF